MIIPDINLLVFAYNDTLPEHPAAAEWWENLVNGTEPVGIPWIVATGFVRLMSNSNVMVPALSGSDAAGLVGNWFTRSHITPINPDAGYLSHFQELLRATGAGGNLVPDAHIAAIAIESNAEVHTHNSRDFARFPGVRWRNPLA